MPPKVLVATFSAVPAPDRHGVFVDNLIRALSVRYELDVLSLRVGELPYVDRYRRARMLRVPLAEGGLGAQVEAFRRAVRRQLASNDYDVIHLRSAWAALPVCRMRSDLDAAVILDLTLSPSTQVRAADREIVAQTLSEEAVCLESADLVIVGSDGARNHLLTQYPNLPVAVVPPGVDVDTFDWEPVPDRAQPVVLYVGSIGPGRGIRMLLSALRFVLEEENVRLVLTGPIEQGFRPVLEEAMARLDLASHVVLTGPVEHDDVPRILAAAALCVVPTLPSPAQNPMGMCPLKLLEYLACRRPTVAPRAALADEILAGARGTLPFAPKSPRDLARAILSGLRSKQEAEAVADAGYRLVRDRWTAAASRRALLDVYRGFAPYAAPLQSAVPVLSGVLPADPKTTTARRFAALHDTVVQAAAAPDPDSSVSASEGRRRDTQPLVPVVGEHPDLLSASGPVIELEVEGEGADSGTVEKVAVEVLGEENSASGVVGEDDKADDAVTGRIRGNPESQDGAGSREKPGGRSLNDLDTVRFPVDVVAGTIMEGNESGPKGSSDGS